MRLKHLKTYLLLPIVLVAVLFTGVRATGEPVAVIANKENTIIQISIPMLKKLYNNDLLKWPNGVPVILYDLDVYNPVRKSFSLSVLGRNSEKIAAEWAHLKITNQALNPPNTIKSERLVIRRVSMQKGAVGYVSLSRLKDRNDIKILTILK